MNIKSLIQETFLLMEVCIFLLVICVMLVFFLSFFTGTEVLLNLIVRVCVEDLKEVCFQSFKLCSESAPPLCYVLMRCNKYMYYYYYLDLNLLLLYRQIGCLTYISNFPTILVVFMDNMYMFQHH